MGIRLLLALLLVPVVAAIATAQQASIHYVYDDLNRLSAVVNQQGDVAVYTYDATGNILKIERFNATELPGAVGISYFSPSIGRTGTIVQVFGKGFSATPGQNSLAFNGTPAVVSSAAPNRLVASVPSGATTGPLSVTTPLGSATSAAPFRVLAGALAVVPAVTEAQAGLTRQFGATEGGIPITNVRWSVNGVAGGAPSLGTIAASGLYTAPSVIPFPATVTITATHLDDTSLTASAQITILPGGPLYAAARSVSVAFAAPAAIVDKSVTSAVSVQVAAGASSGLAAAPAVTVQVAPPAVSFAGTAPVSVAIEPVVTGLDTTSAPVGSTLTLTLTGAGLSETTAITFLRNNVADGTITASLITPSGDGSSVTAEITIAGGSSPGGRVVQVTAGGHISSAAPTAGNVFTVQ